MEKLSLGQSYIVGSVAMRDAALHAGRGRKWAIACFEFKSLNRKARIGLEKFG